MKTTTDLNIVRKEQYRFTWGRVLEVYDLGPRYTIIKACDRNTKEIHFYPYVDGNYLGQSCYTLEEATITAMGYASLKERNLARYRTESALLLLGLNDAKPELG